MLDINVKEIVDSASQEICTKLGNGETGSRMLQSMAQVSASVTTLALTNYHEELCRKLEKHTPQSD